MGFIFHCEVQDGLSGTASSSSGCRRREFHCWSPGAGLWREGIAAHSLLWGQFGLIWRRRYSKVSSLKPLPAEQAGEGNGALAGPRSHLNQFPSPVSPWALPLSSPSSAGFVPFFQPDPERRELIPIRIFNGECVLVLIPAPRRGAAKGIPPARPRPVTSRSDTRLRRMA